MNMILWALFLVQPLILAGGTTASELEQKERDRKAILAQAGAYEVKFHFKETAGFEPRYELKEAYDSGALELIVVVEDSPDKIVLQHVLQTKRGIIKHWRQDWEYENRVLWEYQGERVWEKRKLSKAEARGTWTQRVFQVDDSPRYESYGRWIHMGNLSQWESALTHRPLPRREHTKRDDYNILAARNRHALTPNGWIHEQDNFKLRRQDGQDHVIAREFGLNRYIMTREQGLTEAADWWAQHQHFWKSVRGHWDKVFASSDRIVLKKEVDEKPLYRHLFELSAKVGSDEEDLAKRALVVIEQFLLDGNQSNASLGASR